LGEEERNSAMTRTFTVAVIALLALSAVAHAQTPVHQPAAVPPTDVQYCGALVGRYDTFLNKDGRHGGMLSTDGAANVAAEKCRAGDSSGIADLERALRDAKVALPPRS